MYRLRNVAILSVVLGAIAVAGCGGGGSAGGGAGLPHSGPETGAAEPTRSPAASPGGPVQVRAVGFVGPGGAWADGGLGTSAYLTPDGGRDWRPVAGRGGAPAQGIAAVDFLDGRDGWLAAKGPQYLPHLQIYRTTDGGRRWRRAQVADPGPLAFGSVSFAFGGPEKGIVMVGIDTMPFQSAKAFITGDGGRRWRPTPVPANGEVEFTGRRRLWLASIPGGRELFTSGDGGRSWHRMSMPLAPEASGFAISFEVPVRLADGRLIFPVLDHEHLDLYTHEGGWRRIYRTRPGTLVPRPPSSILLTEPSRDIRVLRIAGDRVVASRLRTRGLVGAFQLEFADRRHGIAVGANECGCVDFTSDGGRTWTRSPLER
jgi:photosystem II stability/assembly factor-like uncharacterized protein